MPKKVSRKVERHAAIIKNLQSNIFEDKDPDITAGRRLAIERWVRTYIRHVEYLEDGELQFLSNVFRDENCWSGARLNNAILGQKLTEEKMGEVGNPFCTYNMACKYCVVDKILPLFQEQFDSYKGRVSPGAVDVKGNPVDDKYIRNDLLDSMGDYDPVFALWIDRESKELKLRKPSNLDGFREAVNLKWSEGVEYFYDRLNKQEKDEGVVNAAIALSSVQCNHNCATALDFCLRKMHDSTKHDLLIKLSEKDQGVYLLLKGLICCGFLDTVQDMVKRWCYGEFSTPADKILSHRDYTLLLSLLSDVMLENSEMSVQAKVIIMDLWRCDRFHVHKEFAVDFSKNIDPITDVLAGLIVDWQHRDNLTVKNSEMFEILQLAKRICSSGNFRNLKDDVVSNLREVGRPGMKKGVNYIKLAEGLFSELEQEASLHSTVDSFGDVHSTLENPGVSDLSSHGKQRY